MSAVIHPNATPARYLVLTPTASSDLREAAVAKANLALDVDRQAAVAVLDTHTGKLVEF